jgi:hypothetical protein
MKLHQEILNMSVEMNYNSYNYLRKFTQKPDIIVYLSIWFIFKWLNVSLNVTDNEVTQFQQTQREIRLKTYKYGILFTEILCNKLELYLFFILFYFLSIYIIRSFGVAKTARIIHKTDKGTVFLVPKFFSWHAL